MSTTSAPAVSGSRAAALDVLHRVWGYDDFRGEQAAIIDQVVTGGDALVLMPTGGGKSLCYQVPALVRDGVGVVVSPLIALMQDQVDALAANGVRAAFLNSTQRPDERARVERAVVSGEPWRPQATPSGEKRLQGTTIASAAAWAASILPPAP